MKRSNSIDKELARLRRDLLLTREAHAEASLRLVEKPDDQGAQGQLEKLEREAQELERRIARLEAARLVAGRRDTADEREAALKRLKDEAAEVDKRNARLAELAKTAVGHFEALSAVLAEYEWVATDNAAGVWSIVRAACEEREAERLFPSLASDARGLAARAPLIAAAYDSGFGRVGLNLTDHVDISRVRAPVPLEAAMAKAASKVSGTLERLIERHEAQLAKEPA